VAQVPYNPVPQVTAQDIATPNVRVSGDSTAFGGAVAKAFQGLGQTLEHSGDQIWQRAVALQEVQNETAARDADTNYMIQTGKLHAEFSSLQGQDAVSAFPKYMEDLRTQRAAIRDSLPNDDARRRYDSSSQSTMGRTIFNGAGHAATQQKVAANGAIEARFKTTADGVYANPTDDVTYEEAKSSTIADNESQAHIKGWTADQAQEMQRAKVSTLLAHRITGLSKQAPFEAQEMLEKYKNDLFGDDRLKVENTVQGQMRQTGARLIANKVGQDPDTTLADRLEAGDKAAKEQSPKDELFPDFVRDRITADYNKQQKAKTDVDRANYQTISSAVLGLNNPDGKVPTTVEELRADPTVDAAFGSLKPPQQRAIMKQLAQNAKGDFNETPERRDRYYQLLGMAHEDPAKFLDQDIPSEQIPAKWRDQLFKQQLKTKVGATQDPRVQRALTDLNGMMYNAGIAKVQDPDKFYQFSGAMQDQIKDFIEEHKKAPTLEDTKKMGAQLIQLQTVPGKWWGTNQTPTYQIDVPDSIKDKLKDRARDRLGVSEPGDKDIQREYVRMRFHELYGGKGSNAGE